MIWRFAAPYDRSLSVMIRLSADLCFLRKSDKQPLGGLGVAAGLDDLIKNISVLVNGTPKPMFSSADGNHDLVQMPDIMTRRFLAAQLPGIGGAELPAPSADRFIGNNDAALQAASPRPIASSVESGNTAKPPER